MKLDKSHQIAVNLGFSIFLFIVILYFVGIESILAVLAKTKIDFVFGAILVYLILNVVMAYRIKVALSSIGEGGKVSISNLFPANMAGMLASDFTPARVGYFFTAFSISSKTKIPIEKTILAIFGPQLFDFLIKAISAALLLIFITNQIGVTDVWLNLAILALVSAGIIFAGLLVFYPPLIGFLSPLHTLPLLGFVFRFLRSMHEHSDGILRVKWPIMLITAVQWLLKGLEWFLLSKALSVSIFGDLFQDIIFMMVFQAAVTLIHFLPIPTLAGAGASEAGFAAILLVFGIPLEVAIAFGLITRALMIFVDSIGLPNIMDYLGAKGLEKSLEELSRVGH